MRHSTALCVTALALLTACGGGKIVSPSPAAPTSSPIAEAPASFAPIPLSAQITEAKACDIPLFELPDRLTTSTPETEGDQGLFLFAQIPEADISLYGIGNNYTEDYILLRKGDTLTAYDLYWRTPRRCIPKLHYGDFDGDGELELLLLTYTGSGTGVSIWTLTVFDPEGDSWTALTLSEADWEDALTPLLSCTHTENHQASLDFGEEHISIDLTDCVDDEIPLVPYVGPIVDYTVSGDTVTAILAVGLFQEDHIGYTNYYVADLSVPLIYNGECFSILSPTLSADPIS